MLRGLLLGVDVAHHFGAQRLRCFIERDGVALGLVHLLAARIAHQRMAQQSLERRAAVHHRAHRQHGVEPVAELARKTFEHQVGRKPLLPIRASVE